jgi:hypothetical protein
MSHITLMSLAVIGDASFEFALPPLIGVDAGASFLDGFDRALAHLVEFGQSRRQGVEAGTQFVHHIVLRLQREEGIQHRIHHQTSLKLTFVITPA